MGSTVLPYTWKGTAFPSAWGRAAQARSAATSDGVRRFRAIPRYCCDLEVPAGTGNANSHRPHANLIHQIRRVYPLRRQVFGLRTAGPA